MALATDETYSTGMQQDQHEEHDDTFMMNEDFDKELLEKMSDDKSQKDALLNDMMMDDTGSTAWQSGATMISNIKMDDLSTMDVMRLFYKSVFPFEKMYQWLNYGNSKYHLYIVWHICCLISFSSQQKRLFKKRILIYTGK